MHLAPSDSVRLKTFIKRAVRLPHAKLEEIDAHLQTGDQQIHRSTISELFQSNRNAREDSEELWSFTESAAQEATFELGDSDEHYLTPEFVAGAVFPAVRALLIRDVLEASAILQRARAFTELTKPFSEILPS